jgi:hypothetical protein
MRVIDNSRLERRVYPLTRKIFDSAMIWQQAVKALGEDPTDEITLNSVVTQGLAKWLENTFLAMDEEKFKVLLKIL